MRLGAAACLAAAAAAPTDRWAVLVPARIGDGGAVAAPEQSFELQGYRFAARLAVSRGPQGPQLGVFVVPLPAPDCDERTPPQPYGVRVAVSVVGRGGRHAPPWAAPPGQCPAGGAEAEAETDPRLDSGFHALLQSAVCGSAAAGESGELEGWGWPRLLPLAGLAVGAVLGVRLQFTKPWRAALLPGAAPRRYKYPKSFGDFPAERLYLAEANLQPWALRDRPPPEPDRTPSKWVITRICPRRHPLAGQRCLYARRDVPQGTDVSHYNGELCSQHRAYPYQRRYHEEDRSSRMDTTELQLIIDAGRHGSEARFANHFAGIGKQNADYTHFAAAEAEPQYGIAMSRRKGPRYRPVRIKATEDIPKGAEVLVDYGINYCRYYRLPHPDLNRGPPPPRVRVQPSDPVNGSAALELLLTPFDFAATTGIQEVCAELRTLGHRYGVTLRIDPSGGSSKIPEGPWGELGVSVAALQPRHGLAVDWPPPHDLGLEVHGKRSGRRELLARTAAANHSAEWPRLLRLSALGAALTVRVTLRLSQPWRSLRERPDVLPSERLLGRINVGGTLLSPHHSDSLFPPAGGPGPALSRWLEVKYSSDNRPNCIASQDIPSGTLIALVGGELVPCEHEMTPLQRSWHAGGELLPTGELCVDTALYASEVAFIRAGEKPNCVVRNWQTERSVTLRVAAGAPRAGSRQWRWARRKYRALAVVTTAPVRQGQELCRPPAGQPGGTAADPPEAADSRSYEL